MENTIQIKIGRSQGGKTIVSARELYEQLEIKTPFHKWFPRMCEYGFVENQDFALVGQKCPTNNPKNPYTTVNDYAITIEMAKELCMIQRTPIGKQCRNYFIECERKLKETGGFAIPQTYAQALALAAQQAEQIEQQQKQLAAQNQQLTEQKPKVEFYDAAMNAKDAKTLQEVAKTIDIPNVGRTIVFRILREKKILDSKNQPNQKYVNDGYFKLIQVVKPIKGRTRLFTQTVVFPTGIEFVRNTVLQYLSEKRNRDSGLIQLSLFDNI